MDRLSCSPRSPCKPRASSGSFDKKLHRSSTCCKKNHPLWLVMYPVPISFIWWSLGHLLKILWTADPCQATSDKWLSPISQNLDPLTACCPHHVDTTYWYLRGVWLPLGECYVILQGGTHKGHVQFGRVSRQKMKRSGFVQKEACAAELACLCTAGLSGTSKIIRPRVQAQDCPTHWTWPKALDSLLRRAVSQGHAIAGVGEVQTLSGQSASRKKRISPGSPAISW